MAIWLAGVLVLCAVSVQAETKITVKSMPPVVIKTFPQAGAIDIDPSTKEIRVTFSKKVITKNI